MKAVHIKSNTFINSFDGASVLIITPSDSKAIDYDQAYQKEAFELNNFLSSVFCQITLKKLKELLP